jgi:hypothetical protein
MFLSLHCAELICLGLSGEAEVTWRSQGSRAAIHASQNLSLAGADFESRAHLSAALIEISSIDIHLRPNDALGRLPLGWR